MAKFKRIAPPGLSSVHEVMTRVGAINEIAKDVDSRLTSIEIFNALSNSDIIKYVGPDCPSEAYYKDLKSEHGYSHYDEYFANNNSYPTQNDLATSYGSWFGNGEERNPYHLIRKASGALKNYRLSGTVSPVVDINPGKYFEFKSERLYSTATYGFKRIEWTKINQSEIEMPEETSVLGADYIERYTAYKKYADYYKIAPDTVYTDANYDIVEYTPRNNDTIVKNNVTYTFNSTTSKWMNGAVEYTPVSGDIIVKTSGQAYVCMPDSKWIELKYTDSSINLEGTGVYIDTALTNRIGFCKKETSETATIFTLVIYKSVSFDADGTVTYSNEMFDTGIQYKFSKIDTNININSNGNVTINNIDCVDVVRYERWIGRCPTSKTNKKLTVLADRYESRKQRPVKIYTNCDYSAASGQTLIVLRSNLYLAGLDFIQINEKDNYLSSVSSDIMPQVGLFVKYSPNARLACVDVRIINSWREISINGGDSVGASNLWHSTFSNKTRTVRSSSGNVLMEVFSDNSSLGIYSCNFIGEIYNDKSAKTKSLGCSGISANKADIGIGGGSSYEITQYLNAPNTVDMVVTRPSINVTTFENLRKCLVTNNGGSFGIKNVPSLDIVNHNLLKFDGYDSDDTEVATITFTFKDKNKYRPLDDDAIIREDVVYTYNTTTFKWMNGGVEYIPEDGDELVKDGITYKWQAYEAPKWLCLNGGEEISPIESDRIIKGNTTYTYNGTKWLNGTTEYTPVIGDYFTRNNVAYYYSIGDWYDDAKWVNGSSIHTPTNGDKIVKGNITYTFNSATSKWVSGNTEYIPKSGDTIKHTTDTKKSKYVYTPTSFESSADFFITEKDLDENDPVTLEEGDVFFKNGVAYTYNSTTSKWMNGEDEYTPVSGDIIAKNGSTYTYNGTKWLNGEFIPAVARRIVFKSEPVYINGGDRPWYEIWMPINKRADRRKIGTIYDFEDRFETDIEIACRTQTNNNALWLNNPICGDGLDAIPLTNENFDTYKNKKHILTSNPYGPTFAFVPIESQHIGNYFIHPKNDFDPKADPYTPRYGTWIVFKADADMAGKMIRRSWVDESTGYGLTPNPGLQS
jgi:hypothetical protein